LGEHGAVAALLGRFDRLRDLVVRHVRVDDLDLPLEPRALVAPVVALRLAVPLNRRLDPLLEPRDLLLAHVCVGERERVRRPPEEDARAEVCVCLLERAKAVPQLLEKGARRGLARLELTS